MAADDDVWAAAHEGLAAIKARVTAENRNEGWIRANRGFSMASFGEDIAVRFRTEGADAIAVHVESKSRIPTTLIDWGQCSRNVKGVIETMKRRLGGGAGIRS